jgi:hypothetical protein
VYDNLQKFRGRGGARKKNSKVVATSQKGAVQCDFPVLQGLIELAGYAGLVEALSKGGVAYDGLFGDFSLSEQERKELLLLIKDHYNHCVACQWIVASDNDLDMYIASLLKKGGTSLKKGGTSLKKGGTSLKKGGTSLKKGGTSLKKGGTSL